jgi:hypothetical protein
MRFTRGFENERITLLRFDSDSTINRRPGSGHGVTGAFDR